MWISNFQSNGLWRWRTRPGASDAGSPESRKRSPLGRSVRHPALPCVTHFKLHELQKWVLCVLVLSHSGASALWNRQMYACEPVSCWLMSEPIHVRTEPLGRESPQDWPGAPTRQPRCGYVLSPQVENIQLMADTGPSFSVCLSTYLTISAHGQIYGWQLREETLKRYLF